MNLKRVVGWCETMGRFNLNTSCEQCTERSILVGCNGSSRNRTRVLFSTYEGRNCERAVKRGGTTGYSRPRYSLFEYEGVFYC